MIKAGKIVLAFVYRGCNQSNLSTYIEGKSIENIYTYKKIFVNLFFYLNFHYHTFILIPASGFGLPAFLLHCQLVKHVFKAVFFYFHRKYCNIVFDSKFKYIFTYIFCSTGSYFPNIIFNIFNIGNSFHCN